MPFETLLQGIFTGLAIGAVYGAIGVGYVVIHRITGVVNFAQGDLGVVGAFVTIACLVFLPTPIALLVGGLAAAGVGALMYLGAVRPLRHSNLLVQTLVLLGAAILIRSVIQLIFGTAPYQMNPFSSGGPVDIGGARVDLQEFWLIGVAIIIGVALLVMLEKTRIGTALRACAVNRHAATLMGINITFMATMSFAISGFVAAIVISTQVPLSLAVYSMGLTLSLKGFIAAVLGGLDKIAPTIIGGFLLGVVESLSAIWISSAYQTAISLGLLLLLLIFKPTGLTRIKTGERV